MSRLRIRSPSSPERRTGLARSIATRMAEEGAAIAVLDISDAGKTVTETTCGAGGRATFYRCDVTLEQQAESAFTGVIQ
jgi:NAD(P)-dependent dehydrogenase (short-subunit alcohol dehydrogenase family)